MTEHVHPDHLQVIRDYLQLFWPAMLVAGATAIAGAVIGVFVSLRRESMLAIGLPHAVAVGTAVAMRLDWPILPLSVVAVALSLFWLARSRTTDRAGTLLPAFYVGAMCVSLLVLANSQSHLAELEHRIVGVDVAVTVHDAVLVVPVLLLCAIICALWWRRWLLLAQFPNPAQLAGVKTRLWDAVFLAILAAVIISSASTSGVVLIMTMLFIPPAIVLPFASRIPGAVLFSIIVALTILVGGIAISTQLDWPVSQSVGGVGLAIMLIGTFIKRK